jgi:predicted ATP-dependent endonuclease of OLD family
LAYIIEFAVAGLAGRKSVYKQKLNLDVNVFFGLNGSGKTSLLKILHSAMSNEPEILERVPFEWAEVAIHSVYYDKNFVAKVQKYDKESRHLRQRMRQLKVNVTRIEDRELSLGQAELFRLKRGKFAWTHKPKLPADSKGNWAHRYLPTWRLYTGTELLPLTVRHEAAAYTESEYDLDIIFARSLEHLWSRYSNKLLSEVRAIQEKGLANILQTILAPTRVRRGLRHLDSKTAYQRVAAFLSRQKSQHILGTKAAFKRKFDKDPHLQSAVGQMDVVEEQIEKATASRNKLEQLIGDMFTGNKKVIFKDADIDVKTDEQRTIPLTSLSSGEKHVLRIFIEALLAEENTLLIDEPEISLHVDWQRRLISGMQQLNGGAQLILATHSPEIMADVPDNKIFRL